jgi:type IV fimbrial biogenesis protein FimT
MAGLVWRCSAPHRRGGARRRGVSLVEGLLVAALTSTLAAATAAHFLQWRARLGVEQVASAFETDVHLARSLALAQRDVVRLAFEPAPNGACWLLHNGPRGSCQCSVDGQALCEAGSQAFRVAHWPEPQAVRLSANVRSLAFDGVRGTVTPAATVRFTGADGKAVHQVVSIMGRVRSCTPSGPWSGYKAC